MNVLTLPNLRLLGFFLLLCVIACSPIWFVRYYANQDGSAHLYSSYIMLELLKGNSALGEIFTFNSLSVPNSSGHWLMVLLLLIFAPFTITKIMVTLTYTGFVASCGWLRLKTVGMEGIKTSFLIGAAIGFNWLWFLGFYNFIIGVISFVFTVGLFFNWREKMNVWRTAVLAVLFLLVYFSHIVSFIILAGSVSALTFSAPKPSIKKNLVFVLLALIPIMPLAVIYKTISATGSSLSPVWRNLVNPYSPVSWLAQIRTADPFIIISRKAFPFVAETSNYFAVFTPLLWILSGYFFLTIVTVYQKNKTELLTRNNLIFAALMFACIFAAVFAPDDFGLNNGSVLRERLLLCGLIFFIPLFRVENFKSLRFFSQICLFFVLLFQSSALWDYSLQTDRDVKEFVSVQNLIGTNESVASVVIIEDDLRFHSVPVSMMNNYLGIEQNHLVWDNYEMGHYLFPLVAKNPSDKVFVLNFTQNNFFLLSNQNQNFNETLSKFDLCLTENNRKMDILFVWGDNLLVENILNKWFEPLPMQNNGRIRIFHHK